MVICESQASFAFNARQVAIVLFDAAIYHLHTDLPGIKNIEAFNALQAFEIE